MHILLADKHQLVRDTIKVLLEGLGPDVNVLETGSLDDALTQVTDAERLDLIILDEALPGINGLDGLAVMRQRFPEVPIVVMSDSYRSSDVLDALAQGARGYISKAMSGKVVLIALRLVLSGEKYVPSIVLSDAHPNPFAVGGSGRNRPFVGGSPRRLSPRERDVLALVKNGLSNEEIAQELGLQASTINFFLGGLYNKLDVANRGQLSEIDHAELLMRVGSRHRRSGEHAPLHLNQRDRDILALLKEGHSNKKIGEALGLKIPALKYHLGRLYGKSGAANRTQAVKFAFRLDTAARGSSGAAVPALARKQRPAPRRSRATSPA